MKKLFLFLLIVTSSPAYTQNYMPFNSSSQKLFASMPDMQSTYSMSFDSVLAVGGDSVYYNFFKLPWEPNFVSYDCPFWGGPECWRQNKPVWIGAKIDSDNMYSYNFYPNNGDTIQFNFNPVYGDPSVFYQDSVQKFSLIYEGTDTVSVLDYPDSARFFKISHSDLEGNQINSQLNGQNIVIGKYIGLIDLFQIDSFPQVLKPLHLIGNKNPNLGITKITNEMVFDYQPGDEIQYREYHFWSNGPPWETYTEYRKHTILERIETEDSLKYLMGEQVFNPDSSFVTTDTIIQKFYRHETIVELPFEVFDRYYKEFYLADYCDLSLWTFYKEFEESLWYCDIDNVWGPCDTNGPPSDIELTYVPGLGIYIDHIRHYNGGISSYYGHYKNIVYFKKDGVTCGDLVVGIEKPGEISAKVTVNPNPSSSVIRFSSDVILKQITLVNSNGKILVTAGPNGNKATIDVSQFPDGIYFAKIEFEGNKFVTKKIAVLR